VSSSDPGAWHEPTYRDVANETLSLATGDKWPARRRTYLEYLALIVAFAVVLPKLGTPGYDFGEPLLYVAVWTFVSARRAAQHQRLFGRDWAQIGIAVGVSLAWNAVLVAAFAVASQILGRHPGETSLLDLLGPLGRGSNDSIGLGVLAVVVGSIPLLFLYLYWRRGTKDDDDRIELQARAARERAARTTASMRFQR
jgi:hypothetical protein